MTNDRIALAELLEKGSDTDVLREMVAFMAERLMAADVDFRVGAGHNERPEGRENWRNGYRERDWHTRAGTIALKIPKLRRGSYFPAFLEPRRASEKAMTAVIQEAYVQETAEAAHVQWRAVCDQLEVKWPRLAAMMAATEHEVLAFMDFPREHRAKIHSTNTLERLNGEVKRRADVVGIFPNEAAIRRLVGALLMEQNDEYAIQKRYMSLDSMSTLSGNPVVSLPAAPALA